MHTKAAETLSAYPRARQAGYLSKKKKTLFWFSLDWKEHLKGKPLRRRTQQRPYDDLYSNLKTSCCNFIETLDRIWRMSSRCQHALPCAFFIFYPFEGLRKLERDKMRREVFVAFCLCVVCLMINQQANWHRGGGWPLVGAAPKLSKVLKASLLHAFFI